ncbi:phosphohydrolase [uncultured Treponema sp.]|uniref:phosphohydrolase n=1 Tax=uncultured Treponema sp. TaxID=162155 RepID=UPI0015ACEC64|nr:phosphohydrolase [uncultured Treponema sp.]
MNAKLDCSKITLGVRYSAPVFFDDGQNMFLAAGHPAKPYHIEALKRWSVPFLLTEGHPMSEIRQPFVPEDDGLEELEEFEEDEDIGELEPL